MKVSVIPDDVAVLKERAKAENRSLGAPSGDSTTVDALKHPEVERHGLPPLGSG